MKLIKIILANLLLSAGLLAAQTASGSGLAISGNGIAMGNSLANCTILTASLPNSTQGLVYNQSINTNNCAAPLTWSVLTGAAPTGAALTTPTAGTVGTLSGTLSAAGTFNFTVKVVDNNGAVATQFYSIVVAAPCVITTTTLPNATTGNLYSQAVNNTGCVAPLVWSVSVGSLPPGITQDTATGVLSGSNPTTPGTYNFTVHVVDNLGNPASQPLSIIVVAGATCTITSPSTLVSGIIGTPYTSSPDITTTGCTAPLAFAIQPGGTIPVGTVLNTATGDISGNPTTAGTSSFTAQVTDALSNVATKPLSITISSVSGADNSYCTISGTWIGPITDGSSNLPTACMFTALSGTPAPGIIWPTSTSLVTLQTTINSAACGDRIPVQQGLVMTGSITLPGKGCDNAHWIWIYSTGITNVAFPAEGVQAKPAISGVASLPGRPSYTCTNCPTSLSFTLQATNASNALKSANTGADHYRVMGAELTRVSTPGASIGVLVDLSSTGVQANHIILDRSYCHGVESTFPQTMSTDTSTTRCMYLGQSNHVAAIDSYFANFYDNGSISSNGNTDAQCIAGGIGGIANSGWGVYKFVNNHCEASGEGILFGGGGGPPLTPPGCTIMVNCNDDAPSDLEVRRNYFFKPLSWNGNTTTVNTVGWPVVKNGFEMKTGIRALFEANVVENCWYSAQGCGTFNVAPVNQQSGGATPLPTCPTCVVKDFTYRYIYSYNTAYGIAVYSFTPTTCSTCQSQGMNRVTIHDNVIGDNLNLGSLTGINSGDAIEILANDDPSGRGLNKTQNLNIHNNTFVKSIRSLILFGGPTSNSQIINLVMQNNIWPYGNFGFVSVGNSSSCDGVAGGNFFTALNNCVTSHTVDHDAGFNWLGTLGAHWPTNGSGLGNFFYTGTAGPGFTNYGTGNSNFNPSNYRLLISSPLHNAGSDGHDLGPDITTLLSKISGVRQ
jgi:hypothetical protein